MLVTGFHLFLIRCERTFFFYSTALATFSPYDFVSTLHIESGDLTANVSADNVKVFLDKNELKDLTTSNMLLSTSNLHKLVNFARSITIT